MPGSFANQVNVSAASIGTSLDPNLIQQIQQILMKTDDASGAAAVLGIQSSSAPPVLPQPSIPTMHHHGPPGTVPIHDSGPPAPSSIVNPAG